MAAMNLIVVFVAFWMLVIGVGVVMLAEEAADRRRDRVFFRQLRNERERMARRYGLTLRD